MRSHVQERRLIPQSHHVEKHVSVEHDTDHKKAQPQKREVGSKSGTRLPTELSQKEPNRRIIARVHA